MDRVYYDIIGGLHGMLMEHIIEQIFCQLDYESLASAEMVSKVWRETLQSSEEIWKNLLKRNVSSFGEDMWKEIYFHLNLKEEERTVHEDYLHYWKICHKIAKTKKMVRHLAWRKGLAHITKRPTIDFTSDRYRVRCCSFAMDEFRIAAGITDGSIQIWNRRTLVQETVLEEGRRVMMNQPRVLAINNRLVVSQTSTSIIVWDIDQCLPVNVLEHESLSPRFLVLRHGYLLSASGTPSDGQVKVAMRKISKEMTIDHIYRPAASESIRRDVCYINFDHRLTVIVLTQYSVVNYGNNVSSCSRDGHEIQTRSTTTFDLLRTKRIPPGRLAAKFCYHNGWIVHTSANHSIEILSAETLDHTKTIPNSEPIFSLSMNLGYLVTQHVSTMRLWDLDGVLSMKPGEQLREQDVLLRSFDDPWHCRSWCSLDDIQIVKWSTSFHNWGSFKLVVRDFLTGLACKANCCTPFASAGPLPVAPRIHRSTHSVSIPNNQ